MRNEERLIAHTLGAIQSASDFLMRVVPAAAEVIVVDNLSHDRTADIVQNLGRDEGIRYHHCDRLGAACARNDGFRLARGDILVAVDADTEIPLMALHHILHCVDHLGYEAGIFRLSGSRGGCREQLWWAFWNQVRRLPLPRAKALPAFMFCTRGVFERYGPFDETVQIGEEWPILAGLYREAPTKFIYDRSMTAVTSSRRMERQRFGYSRTLLRYVWAILHHSGRNGYTDQIR